MFRKTTREASEDAENVLDLEGCLHDIEHYLSQIQDLVDEAFDYLEMLSE
jgi:hypothetical protein